MEGQLPDRDGFGRETDEGFEKEPVVGWGFAQGLEDGALDLGHSPRGGRPYDLAEVLPSCGSGDIDHLLDPGGPQVQQGLTGRCLVLGNQGHRWDAGKIPDQVSYGLEVAAATMMYRNQERINVALANHLDGVVDGIPVQDAETAVAGGIVTGSLAREQHRRNSG